LSFIEFAKNCSVHDSTEFSPFEIVYGFNPLTSIDLIYLPVDERVSLDGNRKAHMVKTRKERFSTHRKSKLQPRGDEPFQIIERINDNAR
jgi:hypothetical protein